MIWVIPIKKLRQSSVNPEKIYADDTERLKRIENLKHVF